MNQERDKFLTEAMGECWHEWMAGEFTCFECDTFLGFSHDRHPNPDYATWEGFGTLWGFVLEQKWAYTFLDNWYSRVEFWGELNWIIDVVDPDRFANAVYDFLKKDDAA